MKIAPGDEVMVRSEVIRLKKKKKNPRSFKEKEMRILRQ